MKAAAAIPCATIALALALTGCELRQRGEEESTPTPQETVAPSPVETPAPVESDTPAASIIRDDASPKAAKMAIPTKPLEATVPFGEGGNDLSERAERVLAGVMASDALAEGWPVVVRGHTDSTGNDRANLRASRARAEAVAAWLVDRGVDDDRIVVIALGEQNPVAPNALPDGEPNEEGRARNRRVEIVIAPRGDEAQEEETATDPEEGPATKDEDA